MGCVIEISGVKDRRSGEIERDAVRCALPCRGRLVHRPRHRYGKPKDAHRPGEPQ